jgi:site-specific DNA recombinase
MDFARIMEVFDQHQVSFVSVTQHFNTTNSMGRLTLNVLLSFAQFEREIIGESIRDKIAASRRKGKWTGGTPVLGYDVDRSGGSPRLVVNPAEASRVQQIFGLYLEQGALLPVVQELTQRRWRTKAWTTRSGVRRGDRPFDKCSLWALLTNPLYAGKIKYGKDLYAGEQEPIVPEELFRNAQRQLQKNGRSGVAELRNRYGALLRGLLFCKACGRASRSATGATACRARAAAKLAPFGRPPGLPLLPGFQACWVVRTGRDRRGKASRWGELGGRPSPLR